MTTAPRGPRLRGTFGPNRRAASPPARHARVPRRPPNGHGCLAPGDVQAPADPQRPSPQAASSSQRLGRLLLRFDAGPHIIKLLVDGVRDDPAVACPDGLPGLKRGPLPHLLPEPADFGRGCWFEPARVHLHVEQQLSGLVLHGFKLQVAALLHGKAFLRLASGDAAPPLGRRPHDRRWGTFHDQSACAGNS